MFFKLKHKNWLLIAGNIFVTLILILLVEFISHLILSYHDSEMPFLICHSNDEPIDLKALVGKGRWYDEIDPLLGWSETEDSLRKAGYQVEHGCIVLRSATENSSGLKVLVTGGSTTDIFLHAANWPIELNNLFRANDIDASIYVAAAGGYNSGQELLKLIRDGLNTGPTVHISYSGANEVNFPGYVSSYEQNFYEQEFKQYSVLLPSTIYLLKSLFGTNHPDVRLKPRNNDVNPLIFWSRNMQLMRGIAGSGNYQFIGVLQPVLGSGKYNDSSVHKKYEWSIDKQHQFYPEALKFVNNHPDYMTDLTAIFDTAKGKVFIDNCHLNDPYQQVVALHIYEDLQRRGLLR